MSVDRLQTVAKWARLGLVLLVVWLAVPLASLWEQPWVLWTALWFLSTRTSFWVQVAATLILGLQFDVLQNWSLGMGVIIAALVSWAMSVAALQSRQIRFSLMVLGGIFFCVSWSWWLAPLSSWSLGWQVVSIVLLASGEVWSERRS